MHNITYPFGFLLFLILSFQSHFSTSNVAVGHTKVSFDVGESGEARASIPINLPKGTILQPSLNIAYSSQGANGLLGLGWNLDGVFQTITRVPATTAQDGFIDGVDFDGSDRFALNGERLIAISGSYGANLTVYHTEQSNFSRVISYGNTGNGPQYFRVRTKDGLLLEFGRVAEARVGLANDRNKVLIWLLNRITDTNGNYLTINYYYGEVNGEYRPVSIEYTGNQTLGKSPYNRVEFYYEDRPDIFTRYLAGGHSRFTKRLKNIVIYDHNQLLRRYELTYLSGVGVSKLHQVTEFGSDNSSCLQPVTINWITNTAGAYDFSKSGTGFWQGHGGGNTNNVIGDFNGDGRTDLAGYAGNGQWHVSLSTGSGFSSRFWAGHGGGATNNVSGDFNGDGLTDLAGYSGNGQWHVSLSTGGGFNTTYWQGHGGGVTNNVIGDFNGDGRTDLAGYAGDGQWHVSLSNGSNFVSSYWAGHAGGASNNVSGDFNGDGRTDLAGYAGNGQWHITLSTGSSFTGGGFWAGHSGGAQNNIAGDFNQDGLTDLAGYAGNGQWHINLSTGTHFEGGFWAGHGGGVENNIMGDFNGDGRTDLAGYAGNGQWHVSLSTGSGFSTTYWSGHGGGTSNNFVGDFNGDGLTDILGYAGEGSWHVALSNSVKELVNYIVHGNELVSVFEYQPLTNTSVYTKGSNAGYPLVDMVGPMYVVSVFSSDDGKGGRRRKTYQYFEGRYDHSGRGFRGFNKISTVDFSANSHVTTEYDRDHRHIAARVKQVTYKTLGGKLIKSIENSPEAIVLYDRVYYAYYKDRIERDYELNGALYNTKRTDFFHDRHGNTIRMVEDYNGQYLVETFNTFVNDEDKWYLGRLTEARVEKSLFGQPKTVKTSTFEYDQNGNLVREILLPDHSSKRLETHYTLDMFGNRVVTTQSGPAVATRSDFVTYDADGRNVIEESNALGHTVQHTYQLGYLQSTTDANGLTTTMSRDAFGRELRADFPDGTWKTTAYRKCGTCPAGAVYYVETQVKGSGLTRSYFDKLDRSIREESEGFDGTPIYQDTRYNADGTVESTSDPYFNGRTSYWTSYQYDELKRVTQETRPGSEVTQYAYNGFETTVTNSENQTSTRVEDAMGNVQMTIDNLGSELYFSYDNDLNLRRRTDFFERSILYSYDDRGFRTGMDDPDMGIYLYEYNTLGQLVAQLYPDGQFVQFEYDLLNRVTRRIESEGTTEWSYDPPNGIGQIASVQVDGVVVESYAYNTDGKLAGKTVLRDGQQKTFSYTYNADGLLATETYPNGYQVRYDYSSRGYPRQVVETTGNAVLWEAREYNADGQVTLFTLGNGLQTRRTYDDATGDLQQIATGTAGAPTSMQDLRYSFSKLGNLQQRRDVNLNRLEDFTYDGLNRLTRSVVAGEQPLDVQYDLLGNITYKSDVGHYNYDRGADGPHVLTSIDHEAVPGCVYNLQQDVTFTSYNYVSSIDNNQTRVEIDYGPERDRTQIRTYKNGQLTLSKTYVDGTYEEIVDATGARTTVCYLQVGSETFAMAAREGNADRELTYIHTDHLGSVQLLTNDGGVSLEWFSYDAWGKQRDPMSWANLETPPPVTPFAKGFTFHEMLDLDWLVFMNARVYNPVLGRFLSPDPFIQFGENMQSLNRYGYVLNNPLSFTDPTGYFLDDVFDFLKENVGTIVGIAISVGLMGADGGFFAAVLSGAAGGFGAAFTDALLAGASFSESFELGLHGGLWGAVSAGITHEIGSFFEPFKKTNKGLYRLKSVIHGVAQGGIAEARGGDFRSGFFGGAAAAFGMSIAEDLGFMNTSQQRIIVGATVGGTASELSGGKFANGALSGAFVAMFNENAHERGSAAYRKAMSQRDPTVSVYSWDVRTTSTMPADQILAFAENLGDLLFYSSMETISYFNMLWSSPFATIDYYGGPWLDALGQSVAGIPHPWAQAAGSGVQRLSAASMIGSYVYKQNSQAYWYYRRKVDESFNQLIK